VVSTELVRTEPELVDIGSLGFVSVETKSVGRILLDVNSFEVDCVTCVSLEMVVIVVSSLEPESLGVDPRGVELIIPVLRVGELVIEGSTIVIAEVVVESLSAPVVVDSAAVLVSPNTESVSLLVLESLLGSDMLMLVFVMPTPAELVPVGSPKVAPVPVLTPDVRIVDSNSEVETMSELASGGNEVRPEAVTESVKSDAGVLGPSLLEVSKVLLKSELWVDPEPTSVLDCMLIWPVSEVIMLGFSVISGTDVELPSWPVVSDTKEGIDGLPSVDKVPV
jgi:hypothetical protein